MKQPNSTWIWLSVLVLAILAHTALAMLPFTLDEAVTSLAALNAGASVADSTFLFTGQVLSFTMFGTSDTIARLIPALLGIVLVMLPWFWQEHLGQAGAVVLSLLLLFSPITLAASRNVDSTVLAVCAMALLATGAMFTLTGRKHGDAVFSAGVVLALTGGDLVWDMFIAAGITLVVVHWRRKDLLATLRLADFRKPLLAGGAIALAMVTWMGFYAGWAGLFQGLAAWWHSWQADIVPYGPLRLLLMYEPALCLVGLVAIVVAVLPKSRTTASSILTLFTGILIVMLALRPGAGAFAAAAMVVPLAVLVALMIQRWGHIGQADQPTRKWAMLYSVAVLLGLMPVFFAIAQHASGVNLDPAYFVIVGAIFVLVIQAFLALLARLVMPRVWVFRAALSGLTLFLMVIQLSYATNLAFVRGHSPAEALIEVGGTEDLRALVSVLDTLAVEQSLRRDGLPVAIVDDGSEQSALWVPLVAWTLRDFDKVDVVETVPLGYSGYVITREQSTVSPNLAGRQGMRFTAATQMVHPRPVCASLLPLDCQKLAGWFLYRQPVQSPAQYTVILWAP